MIQILHISHTDIKKDSRILKEMNSLAKNEKYKLNGIGMQTSLGTTESKNIELLNIISLNMKTRSFRKLPSVIRHILVFIELSYKMFLQALKLKPDVVHCHDNAVLHVAMLIKLFTGSKIVYDAHELESDRNNLSKLAKKITFYQEKIFWRYIDRLIVVSYSIKDWYQKNIGPKKATVILNSPVFSESASKNKSKYLREKFSISNESKIFLYVGMLRHGRGLDLITEVFKKEDVKSSLVFLGYGELTENLKKLSHEYNNIYVHDAVAHEEVVSIANSADIGLCLIQSVSLSDYYCLPNKLFEYCFAEIPVLASNFPDISRAVEKFNLGKCTDLDMNSIYKAVKEYESMSELPQVDINNLDELSWNAQEKKLIELYDELIDIKN